MNVITKADDKKDGEEKGASNGNIWLKYSILFSLFFVKFPDNNDDDDEKK